MVTRLTRRTFLALFLLAATACAWQLPHRREHFRSTAWAPPAGLVSWFYAAAAVPAGGTWIDQAGTANATIESPGHVDLAQGLHVTGTESGGAARIADNDLFEFGDGAGTDYPRTICAWVYYSSAATGQGTICSKNEISYGRGQSWSVVIYDSMTGISVIVLGTGGGWLSVRAAHTIPVGQWQHIAVTYSGSKSWTGIKVYHDGELVAVANNSSGTYGSAAVSAAEYRLRDQAANQWYQFPGWTDDHMFFAAELSQAQIQDIMANSPGHH